jgi:methyl-accepting chemotaxis protein
MQETSKQIQGNAEASARLAGLSKGLQEMVGQFKL